MSAIVQKLLLLAWDGADWRMMQPLLDAGLLPTLESLLDTGTVGHLSSLRPDVDPLVWTSLVTGKRADRHGVVSHLEPAPISDAALLVSGLSRRSSAVWEILDREGLKCQVVGWPLVPAEAISGTFVSQLFARVRGQCDAPLPPTAGTISPESKAPELEACRVHPDEITAADLKPLVPHVEKLGTSSANDIAWLKSLLAETATIHAVAIELMQHESADFTMVCFDLLDRAGHRFMQFHPPHRQHVDEQSFAIWHRVMVGLYQFFDRILARLLEVAGPETAVMLVSPHGFHCDGLRPSCCKENQADVAWHREYGVLLLRAPGVLCDEWTWGAGVLDVVPTILTLFGLPVGNDMEGRPLRQAFECPLENHSIESWDAGQERTKVPLSDEAAQEFREALIEQGYLTNEDFESGRAKAETNAAFRLAVVHLESGRPALAAPLLRGVYERSPDETQCALQFARCMQDLGELEECRRIAEDVVRRGLRPLSAAILLSSLSWKEGNHREALDILFDAEQSAPDVPGLHCQIGDIYLDLERWDEAERAFRKALKLDTDSTRGWNGLSVVCLATGRLEQAADHALTAIGLSYHLPTAHFHLGAALARMGAVSRAIQAFEVCLDQRPETKQAHVWLASLYRDENRDPEKAAFHRRQANKDLTSRD